MRRNLREEKSREPTHGAVRRSRRTIPSMTKPEPEQKKREKPTRKSRGWEAHMDRHHEYIVWAWDGAESQSQYLWR
jgi:hypothetical protein